MPRTGTVVRVVDGDTVVVRVAGRVRTVDLKGIRAPVGRQCMARASLVNLRRGLPPRTEVALVFGRRRPAATARRFSAVVTSGDDAGRVQVLNGYARAVGRLYRSDESIARDEDDPAGLWKRCPSPSPATTPGATGPSTAPAPTTDSPVPGEDDPALSGQTDTLPWAGQKLTTIRRAPPAGTDEQYYYLLCAWRPTFTSRVIPNGNTSLAASSDSGTWKLVGTSASPRTWQVELTSVSGATRRVTITEPGPNELLVDSRPVTFGPGIC